MSQEESANQADHPIHQPVDSGATASPHMGGRLAAAREQAGLSVEEVAGKLRLSPRQVEALEAGDAEALPGAMFVRGFMRNYARLLGIDPEPLLEAYQEATPAPARHEISLQSINIAISQRNVKSSVPYVLVALALLLALAVWALFMQNPVSTPPAVTPTPQENQTSSVSEAVTPSPPPNSNPLVPPATDAAAIEPNTLLAVTPPLVETAPASDLATGTDRRLIAKFTAPAWVSVTDAGGKLVYQKTAAAQTEQVIEAAPPLKVVIGDAGAVELIYRGKRVDLAPYTSGNVARLQLE